MSYIQVAEWQPYLNINVNLIKINLSRSACTLTNARDFH